MKRSTPLHWSPYWYLDLRSKRDLLRSKRVLKAALASRFGPIFRRERSESAIKRSSPLKRVNKLYSLQVNGIGNRREVKR